MSTFMPKADEIERNWYVLDAAGKPLGRVAAEAAVLLRGKNKPIFTPNVDCGDFVIIINTDKAVLTGDKLNKKLYQHHTGYIGNLKEVKYGTLMKKRAISLCSLLLRECFPAQLRAESSLQDATSIKVQTTSTRLRSPLFGNSKGG